MDTEHFELEPTHHNKFEDIPELTYSDSKFDENEHYDQLENSATPSVVSAVHMVVVLENSYHTEVVEDCPYI